MKRFLTDIGQRFLPVEIRRKIVQYTRWPAVGWVRFGSFRRLTPISGTWGSERGRPIDRNYIAEFLQKYEQDIKGHVLEFGTKMYTARYGGTKVTKSDVLHVAEKKSHVTIIADITSGGQIPSNTFDCILLTQTLNAIYDVSAAIKTVYRILKPGGVVLATMPGISKISRYDMDRWGYYWSFTSLSAKCLFASVFPEPNITVEAHGNVLTAVAFLHGLSIDELRQEELNYSDPDYELLITVRASKPANAAEP